MLPEAFTHTSTRHLCGIQIDEPTSVLHTISEGMGFRVFKRDVTKITMSVSG